MSFPKCACGNIVTEDDCGASTDEDGFTWCCDYNPYTGQEREYDGDEDES